VLLEPKVLQVHKVLLGLMEQPVLRVSQDQQAPQVLQEKLALLDLKESKGLKES
jgi:hypothetical protein